MTENETKIGSKKARKLALKEPKHENVAYKKALQTGLQGVYTGKKVVEEVTPDNTKQLRQKAKQIAKDENRNQNVVYRQLVAEEYQPATYEKVAVYPQNRVAYRQNGTSKMIIKLAQKTARTQANKVKARFPDAPNSAIQEVADRKYANTIFSLTTLFRNGENADG